MADNGKKVLILANILGLLGLLSINIYLPGLPFIIHYFHTSAETIKLSISLFLLGFALSQFFWGSLSERFGRKKPILYGLLLSCAGTLITMLAPTAFIFNTGRLIEGVGIGCASVLTRALLTDSFKGVNLSVAISYITTAANIMPALAPIIGGYLLNWFGWRYIFLFLLIYTISLLLVFYKKLPETHQAVRSQLNFKEALADYWVILRERKFIGYLFPYILMSGGMVGYYAAAPFIFISILHISPQHYGFAQIVTVISYILGNNLSRWLTLRLGMEKTIIVGTIISLVSAIFLLISWIFFNLNIFTVLIPMTVFCLASGLIAPGANAGAMSTLSHKAGSAGAMIGAIIYATSALFSAIITNQNLSTLGPLTIYVNVIAILSVLGFITLIMLRTQRN